MAKEEFKGKLTRIGGKFNQEIEKIKQERLDRGIDKKKKSTRRLTDLIIKHTFWEDIKEDTIAIEMGDEKNEKKE